MSEGSAFNWRAYETGGFVIDLASVERAGGERRADRRDVLLNKRGTSFACIVESARMSLRATVADALGVEVLDRHRMVRSAAEILSRELEDYAK